MKALVKLAVCGLIAVAASTQAFANGALQMSNALKSPAGRAYLAQMNITAATPAAEVTNILKGLSASEYAAVSRAINLFNSKYVAGNTAANNAAADAAFKVNGQIAVIVAANAATTTRGGVDSASGPTCNLSASLSNGTKFSASETKLALDFWGPRVAVGSCNADAGGLVGYNVAARENFIEAAIMGMDKLKRMGDYSGVSTKAIWAEMLAVAKSNDPGAEARTASQEVATVDALTNSCHILKGLN